jgi:hypothetical protein
MTSGTLLIVFQSSNNARSLLIAQESSIIGKIDYNPEGSYPYKYSSNTLKDLKDSISFFQFRRSVLPYKYPSPAFHSADTVHL